MVLEQAGAELEAHALQTRWIRRIGALRCSGAPESAPSIFSYERGSNESEHRWLNM